MKRVFNNNETSLSDWESLRIHEIFTRLHIENKSWLEGLAQFQRGALLAKILYKLQKADLHSMCSMSKSIYDVCRRYQLLDRLYSESVFMFGIHRRMQDSVGVPREIQCISKVATIFCGENHTGIVTSDGKVYMDYVVGTTKRIQNIPKIAILSCGWTHTGIVTIGGDVYMFGCGLYGKLGDGDINSHSVGIPTKIQNIPKAAAVSCGLYHTGILTVDGDVYMFGNGRSGRLGDGDRSNHNVGIPRKIQNIPKVTTISCGSLHTGIVTVDGDVYMFGDGEYGKLGDGNITYHSVGILRKIQGIPKVITISCGYLHTGILTVDGDVYMFGNGRSGRLGDGDITYHNVGIPRKIPNIPKVTVISCGVHHTGIVTVGGDVYMFGNGEYGKLGDGDITYHSVGIPRKIQNIPKVSTVSCGSNHTAILTISESSLNLTI